MNEPLQRQGTESFTSFQTSNHYHNNRDSPAFPFTNLTNRTRFIQRVLVGSGTNVAVGTTIAGNLVMPFGGNFIMNGVSLSSIGATVDTAGTTGNMTINVLLNGTSIFNQGATVKDITIATGSTTSRGNTSQPTIGTFSFKLGDILTFNVDTIQTTPAKGLTIFIKVIETTV